MMTPKFTPNVTRETIQALASLAGLSLDEGEVDALLPQIVQTVENVAALDAVGLDGVEPAIRFKQHQE